MKFQIEGKIRLGKDSRKFTKTIDAPSEGAAKEKVMALFGSQNRAKRNAIQIEKVEKLSS